ncbi:restriction endonuclease subunit S [Leeuwenhoekiella palythoae]|uniref:restriction endonuclease subunit S n=1 Tax=Leeuwenhoekiella palythoae TaxID=573501 RepID=UPI001CE0DB64|nr:restriction endonuclease subunit S [Leeuwenhoekiella palythoae]UBZ10943.1 restriction endonuclease subunit S [Leeuwenhoekiella palythoae]
MSKEKKQVIPDLRFPEFRNSEGWNMQEIGEFINETQNIASKTLPKYSLTIEDGVIPKSKRYERSFLVKDDLDAYKVVSTDDFVYNPMNLRFGAIAKYRGKEEVAVSKYYNVFNCDNSVVSSFCEFYFKSYPMITYYNDVATGSLIEKRRVHFSEFLKFKIPFPKFEEQQKIANCLSSLDEVISAETEKLDLLQDHKKGLLQQLFPQEGETQPKYRFPEFKEDWAIKEVSQIFDVTRGYVLSMSLVSEAKTEENKFPVYSSQTKNNGLAGFYNEFLYEDAITWTTDGANAGDVNFREGKFYCTNVCGVLLNKNGFANKCVAEIINSVAKKHVSYVGNPKLMNGVMSKIKIAIPSLKEQQKIASCLATVDELIESQKQKIEDLQAHKKGLLQQLFPKVNVNRV